LRHLLLLLSVVLLSGAMLIAQDSVKPSATEKLNKVVHVIGLEGIKQNSKGELAIQNGTLDFQSTGTPEKTHGQIKIASIEDIFTGQDSRQVGGTPLNVVKLAAPFGSGRALSLFAHQKIDNLTVEYRDENNGFHGVIFLMSKGQAELAKKELIAQGAHASSPISDEATQPAGKKEKK
jgi:hypothetical protein